MSIDAVSLYPGAVEYLHWTISDAPSNPSILNVYVSFDNGVTWNQASILDGVVSLLIAHFSETGNTSAIILSPGSHNILIKFVDTVESVVRNGGIVYIV